MAHEWESLAHDPEISPLLFKQTEDGREVARTYMRHTDREIERNEIEALERKLADPVERRFMQNPGKLIEQNGRRKKNLLAQSPAPLTASQRDKLAKLEASLRAFVGENMPTAEQMRHNPPGAVDHHMAWTRHTKRGHITWQNVRILQHPDSDARDLANFERYRPSNAQSRNLYADAQIPGVFGLSPQAKEHYDQIDWNDPAAVAREAEQRGYTLVQRGTPAQGRPKPAKALAPVTATCDEPGCTVSYRGGFGASNLRRHKAQAHGVREEVPA